MSLRIKGKEGISSTSLEIFPLEDNSGGTYQTQTISAGEILELDLTGDYKISYSGTKPFVFGDNTPDNGGDNGGDNGTDFPSAQSSLDVVLDISDSSKVFSDQAATIEADIGDEVSAVRDSLNDILFINDGTQTKFTLEKDDQGRHLLSPPGGGAVLWADVDSTTTSAVTSFFIVGVPSERATSSIFIIDSGLTDIFVQQIIYSGGEYLITPDGVLTVNYGISPGLTKVLFTYNGSSKEYQEYLPSEQSDTGTGGPVTFDVMSVGGYYLDLIKTGAPEDTKIYKAALYHSLLPSSDIDTLSSIAENF